MELHYKLSHLPLPAMIMLAEKGWIKKKFAKLKHRIPICMYWIFGMAHCTLWHSKGSKRIHHKSKQQRSWKMCQYGSIGISTTRTNTSNGWFPNKLMHLGSNCVCRPFLRLRLCGSYARSCSQWDPSCEIILLMACKWGMRFHQFIPCR